MNSVHKAANAASSFPASRTQKDVGPIHSKICFFIYQTDCICVLNKTQTQPRYQTGSSSIAAVGVIPFIKSRGIQKQESLDFLQTHRCILLCTCFYFDQEQRNPETG